ncbi:hypothetical protein NQ036_03475 [Brevibacterium sp. 91QC2O2]|uniref:hypothetical protein n=1 Tax=Brevibacterium sp. 91QC2O2 TaxID=2968458 RepID=UPI00211BE124|nr:hypothetical protein [Brevibacterium sp. 91QC2O2]MCQ9367307.1 hypothetical protein [Brevibacterium sp. 91QC2O2]
MTTAGVTAVDAAAVMAALARTWDQPGAVALTGETATAWQFMPLPPVAVFPPVARLADLDVPDGGYTYCVPKDGSPVYTVSSCPGPNLNDPAARQWWPWESPVKWSEDTGIVVTD